MSADVFYYLYNSQNNRAVIFAQIDDWCGLPEWINCSNMTAEKTTWLLEGDFSPDPLQLVRWDRLCGVDPNKPIFWKDKTAAEKIAQEKEWKKAEKLRQKAIKALNKPRTKKYTKTILDGVAERLAQKDKIYDKAQAS